MRNINKHIRKLALDKLKQWVKCDDDYGSLCQFSWRHNRKTPAFFNYPIIKTEYETSLDTTVDEIVVGKHGYVPSDKKLYDLNIPVYGYFDMVVIHKGIPVYCFKLIDTDEVLTEDNVNALDIYTEFKSFGDYDNAFTDELKLYQTMAKESNILEIHYIDINYIIGLQSVPTVLDTKLIFSRR